MQFDKPKVTIDLEEYQYLKDKLNGDAHLKAMTDAAKKILFYCGVVMSTGRGSMVDVKAELIKSGVRIIEYPYTDRDILGWERIDITIEKQNS